MNLRHAVAVFLVVSGVGALLLMVNVPDPHPEAPVVTVPSNTFRSATRQRQSVGRYCKPATSRFAVVSLYGDPPDDESEDVYGAARVTYALKLLASVRRFVAVDTIMLVPTNGTRDARLLERAGWQLCPVPPLVANWSHLTRQTRIGIQSKLYVWALVQYEGVLFLDFDTLVVGDISQLFTMWLPSLASSNITLAVGRDYPTEDLHTSRWGGGASDSYINAGVLLVRPDAAVFEEMRTALTSWQGIKTDSCEQAFIGQHLVQAGRVVILPAKFNAVTVIAWTTPLLWEQLRPDMRILHYTLCKPHNTAECTHHGFEAICAQWRAAFPKFALHSKVAAHAISVGN